MCHAVRCRICGKVTWAGCGDHVDQALAGFAEEDLCEGHDADTTGQPGQPGRSGQSNPMARFFRR